MGIDEQAEGIGHDNDTGSHLCRARHSAIRWSWGLSQIRSLAKGEKSKRRGLRPQLRRWLSSMSKFRAFRPRRLVDQGENSCDCLPETSSAADVGADKDSDRRQREVIEAFARRAGYELVGEFLSWRRTITLPAASTPDLKNRLCDVETDCRDCVHVWLPRIVGALAVPRSMALPAAEPSAASQADLDCEGSSHLHLRNRALNHSSTLAVHRAQ
jgi:hypothetical protein